MAATQDLGVLPPEAFIPVGPPPGPGQKARARSICGYYEVEGEKLPEEELLEHIVEVGSFSSLTSGTWEELKCKYLNHISALSLSLSLSLPLPFTLFPLISGPVPL
jgi:hypothetical protein